MRRGGGRGVDKMGGDLTRLTIWRDRTGMGWDGMGWDGMRWDGMR